MEEKEYTLQEIVELTGLTKNIVAYRIREKVPEDLKRIEGNAWRVKSGALDYIGDKRVKPDSTIESSEQTIETDGKTIEPEEDHSPSGTDAAMNALLEDLKIMREELKIKNAQISALNEALISAQAITAGHIKLQIEAKNEPTDEKPIVDAKTIETIQTEGQSIETVNQTITNSDPSTPPEPMPDIITDEAKLKMRINSMTFFQKLKFAFTGELPEDNGK